MSKQFEAVERNLARRGWRMSLRDTPPALGQDDVEIPVVVEENADMPANPSASQGNNGSSMPPSTGRRDVLHPPVHALEAIGATHDIPTAAHAHPSSTPASPSHAATGPSGGDDGLPQHRSSSTTSPTPNLEDVDPRSAHPGLTLSGNVISAAFCVPYKIAYAADGEWELSPRRGTSALFDSFSYLSSANSPWKHTLVGWTGEIDRAADCKESNAPSSTNNGMTSMDAVPLNKASAPIPVNRGEKSVPPQETAEMKIPLPHRLKLEKKMGQRHGAHVAPVWLWDEMDENNVATFQNQQRWRHYGEHELLTLFHYKQNEPTDGRSLRKAWADYCCMNKAFADAILDVYKPGDVVLIHDYQLMLLPSLLRQRLPGVYVGFFLHVPFPSSEYYRSLTRRKELLEGVLGANMIGFQAYSYARHFSSCCTRVLAFDSSSAGIDAYGSHVPVDVFPIGINAEATIAAAFESPVVEQKMEALRDLYANKKIIVGRDRLDTVKGVTQKLQAFEIFLERHPEWHDNVILIQVTSPTSAEERNEKGDKTANKVAELVARINGSFGSLSSTPVQHYPQYLSKAEYFALLRIADVGLITSVRDGMNTTALEYVICQRYNHAPLIISEFSATAGSLGDAIHINPWDLGSTAEAINTALTMTESVKKQNHDLLYKHVTSNTVQYWMDSYIKRLLTYLASYDQSVATPVLDCAKLLSQYRHSSRRLFMFDYDGTLTPIVQDPQAAIPSDRVIQTLKTLASDSRNQVWIISGRDQAFLEKWMGHISELGLSAEHGCFMRNPHGGNWNNLTETLDMAWQSEVMEVFDYYSERTPGSFVERKKIALTWHYRRADPEYGAFMARECLKHLESTVAKNWEVDVMTGKANLEVRPRFVNKGEIAARLVKEYGPGADKAPDFVLCLGDDFTDEDMFRTLRRSSLPEEHRFAVTVGAKTKQTLATWHLLEPSDVISAIRLLNNSTDADDVEAVAVADGAIPDSRS